MRRWFSTIKCKRKGERLEFRPIFSKCRHHSDRTVGVSLGRPAADKNKCLQFYFLLLQVNQSRKWVSSSSWFRTIDRCKIVFVVWHWMKNVCCQTVHHFWSHLRSWFVHFILTKNLSKHCPFVSKADVRKVQKRCCFWIPNSTNVQTPKKKFVKKARANKNIRTSPFSPFPTFLDHSVLLHWNESPRRHLLNSQDFLIDTQKTRSLRNVNISPNWIPMSLRAASPLMQRATTKTWFLSMLGPPQLLALPPPKSYWHRIYLFEKCC